jgi:hypothetical protein
MTLTIAWRGERRTHQSTSSFKGMAALAAILPRCLSARKLSDETGQVRRRDDDRLDADRHLPRRPAQRVLRPRALRDSGDLELHFARTTGAIPRRATQVKPSTTTPRPAGRTIRRWSCRRRSATPAARSGRRSSHRRDPGLPRSRNRACRTRGSSAASRRYRRR